LRALAFHGPGAKSWDDVPDPKIEDDEDVVVQLDSVTNCGTDLHIALLAGGALLLIVGLATLSRPPW
jgi:threonine dehydrogenase-like Zn-dependent dehydrogenase